LKIYDWLAENRTVPTVGLIPTTRRFQGRQRIPSERSTGLSSSNLVDGKKTNLGYYATAVEAAAAYNHAAIEAWGEFAYQNPIDPSIVPQRLRGSKNSLGHVYRGVNYHKRLGKWMAYAKGENGKRVHLGYFRTEEEALNAHNMFLSGASA
jgi:hypothetical protein